MSKISKKQEALNKISTHYQETLQKDYIKMVASGSKIMCQTIIDLVEKENYDLEKILEFCRLNLDIDNELFIK